MYVAINELDSWNNGSLRDILHELISAAPIGDAQAALYHDALNKPGSYFGSIFWSRPTQLGDLVIDFRGISYDNKSITIEQLIVILSDKYVCIKPS
jgi:hypothetical protein